MVNFCTIEYIKNHDSHSLFCTKPGVGVINTVNSNSLV